MALRYEFSAIDGACLISPLLQRRALAVGSNLSYLHLLNTANNLLMISGSCFACALWADSRGKLFSAGTFAVL